MPVQGGHVVQAFSAEGVLVVLYAMEAVAHVSTSAEAAPLLQDAPRLEAALRSAGVPIDTCTAVCHAVQSGAVTVQEQVAGAQVLLPASPQNTAFLLLLMLLCTCRQAAAPPIWANYSRS